jgi:hypothetical protein
MAVIRLRRRLAAVHGQLVSAKHDPTTPLYQRGKVDRTKDNIFFNATAWQTFLGHLKWVIASKDIFVRVATDMTLINVYVGNTSVKSRQREQLQNDDDPLLVSASIEDLLAGPDLVVVPLGHTVHYNRASANVLLEALLLRSNLGKPTWLVEPPGKPFTPWTRADFGVPTGMPSCNDDVLAFVNTHFEKMHLEAREGERESTGIIVDDEAGEVTIEGPSELGEMVPDEPQYGTDHAEAELIEELQGKSRKRYPSRGQRRGGYG